MAVESVTKAVVIGAGISGLTAAKELREKGYEVVVLEARDRIGGRMHTDTSTFGYPVDLGASWIHGLENNPLTPFVTALGVQVHPTNDEAVYTTDGRRFDRETELKLYNKEWELYCLVKKVAGSADPLSFGYKLDGVHSVKDFLVLNQEKLFEDLNVKAEEVGILSSLFLHLEGNDGEKFEKVSFHSMDTITELEGDHVIFPNGYTAFLRQIVGEMHCEQVLLGHIVHSVICNENGRERVIVETSEGDFVGDLVIVTVPPSVLKAKKIKFHPPLPQWKERAIEKIGFGLYNKVMLEFEECFWPEDIDVFRVCPLKEGFAIDNGTCKEMRPADEFTQTFVNYKRLNGRNTLMCTLVSERARFFESLSDEEAKQIHLDKLEKVFGKPLPPLKKFWMTRWNSDPFSLGSYPHIPVGSSADELDRLEMPINSQVYFAGDTTCKQANSCVHGAYLSGLKVADRIGNDWPMN